jgi:hypothetical protein
MTLARLGPATAISRKKRTRPSAVQIAPSAASEASASSGGTWSGGTARAAGRRDDQGRGDRPERVEVGEAPLDDDRRDRVAERRYEDPERPEQLVALARDVDADERHDAEQAQCEADQPQPRRPILRCEAQRQQRHHQRHRGDQDRRQRR